MALRHKHLQTFIYRQHLVIMVLKHHNRFQLCIISLLHKLGISNELLRFNRVEIRILKQSNAEHIQQQSACRQFKTFARTLFALFLAPHFVSLKHRTNLVVTSELVNSCLQNLVMTLSLVKLFHTPRLTAYRTVKHFNILCYSPVGTCYTLKLCFIAQLLLYQPLAIAAAHVLARWVLIPQYTIYRHHGRGHLCTALKLEGPLYKRAFVHRQVVSGIYSILSRCEVRVTPALLCTITIPVFNHGVHTLHAPPFVLGCCLECIAVCTGHIRSQLRVLSECTIESEPAWIGSYVYLRRQGSCNTQGTILLRCYLSEAIHQLRVESSSKT